jgi:aminoglycoside phosphotransferase (APT) family kinase protein
MNKHAQNRHHGTVEEIARGEALAERLAHFIAAQEGVPARVCDLERFTAGFSWITYSFRVLLGDHPPRDLILRIGDPNGLLAPYSARPEFLALTAVLGLPRLPVPRPQWFSDDPGVIGAPFLVTERMFGNAPLPVWDPRESERREGDRSALLDDFVDALVAIHSCDWRGTPAEQLTSGATVADATRRQVDHWIARGVGDDDGPVHPALSFAREWLRAHAPAAPRVALLHGDYRVGNFLVRDGRISAILDWELAHLGDPHEDLAWLGLRTFGGSERLIGGLFDRPAFFERYEARSGLRVDQGALRYFEVFSQFKVAVMLSSAERRIARGTVHDIRLGAMALQMSPTLMGLISMIRAAS